MRRRVKERREERARSKVNERSRQRRHSHDGLAGAQQASLILGTLPDLRNTVIHCSG